MSWKNRKARHSLLSLWSIWSRNQINESGVKGHASRERGVRVKLFEKQNCIHLHLQEVEPDASAHTASTYPSFTRSSLGPSPSSCARERNRRVGGGEQRAKHHSRVPIEVPQHEDYVDAQQNRAEEHAQERQQQRLTQNCPEHAVRFLHIASRNAASRTVPGSLERGMLPRARLCDMSKSLAESSKHVRLRRSKLGSLNRLAYPFFLGCVCFLLRYVFWLRIHDR